jgi:hypothetical protein
MRLAALVAFVVVVIVVIVLLLRSCGGQEAEQPGGTAQEPGQTSPAATAEATQDPKPVSTTPPLVGLGDTVRFETPEGAVVRVTVDDYADPGTAPDGVSADAGERIVTLRLSVTAEGEAGTAAVPLPFEKADSFILVMENDELATSKLGDGEFLGTALQPGKTASATLAFSVGASPPIRFVCTPVEGSVPRSATWELD